MTGYDPPHPPSLPDSDGGLRPESWLWRNRHVTVPLLLPPLFLVAGLATRLTGTGPYAALAGVVVTLMMAIFAPVKWDRLAEVVYAIASAACWSGWVIAVAFAGVSGWSLIPLAVLGLAWGIPWWRHKRPRAKSAAAKLVSEWDAWWQHHCRAWDLAGSRVANVLVKGVMETLIVQLWRGRQSARQVEQAVHLIESALGGYVRHGMLRVQVNPKDPSQVLIRLRRENPLAEMVPFDPSLVPASVMEPAPIGVTESGERIMTVLAGNWFVAGRTRGGKSNQLSVFLATLTGACDARVWLIDRKGGRAARPWMAALDWCAVSIEEARILLRAAAAEVVARAMHAYDGHEQLQPAPEIPALFVVIDETHEVTSEMRGDAECAALLAAIASMGSGVAVYVVVLTQYGALAESVRSEQVRSNLPNRICFAVTRPEHGAFALSDWDKLNAARLAGMGEFYWQRGPECASEPGRGPHMPHDLVRAIAARNGAMPRRPLVLYAGDHQEIYDTRWSRLPDAFVPLAPQAQGAPRAPLPRPAQEASMNKIVSSGSAGRADAVACAARIEDEVAATPDIDVRELRADDAALRRVLGSQRDRFALALAMAGPEGISPRRLREACGMSRSWVHQQLDLLIERGAVTKPGEAAYRQAAGQDVKQEMEAIRGDHERLLAEAVA